MFGFIVLAVCLIGCVMAGMPVVLSDWESARRRRDASIGALVLVVLTAGSVALWLGNNLPRGLAVVIIVAAVLVTGSVEWQIRHDRAMGAPVAESAFEGAPQNEAGELAVVSLGRHGRIDPSSSDDVVTIPRRALRPLPDPQ